jgi:mono/diheme cytochrome c family protein
MRMTVAVLGMSAFVVSAAYVSLGAQARGASSGVYTAEQATRGNAVYKEQCAACHGDNLEGSGPMPPLAGMDFLANWQGKSLGELYEKTQVTMPATAPGTLTAEQAADVVAYLLKVSRYPEGTMALEGRMEALASITLDAVTQ